MMLLGLVALLALVVGGLLGLGLLGYPGYLLLVWEGWRLETSVWVALVGLVLFIAVLFCCYFFLASLVSAPLDLAYLWRKWRQRRALRLSNEGIIDWLNGDWKRSFKVARRSIEQSPTPVLQCLIAADAALHNEELSAAQNALADARQYLSAGQADNQKEVQFALAVFDARLAYQRQDYATCISLLQPLIASKRKHILKLYQEACARSENWQELEKLLPKLEAVMDKKQWQQLRKATYQGLFAQIQPELADDKRLADLSYVWRRLPKNLRADFIVTYVRGLLGCGAHGAAEQLLGKELNANLDLDLLDIYLGIDRVAPKQKLALLESLKKLNPKAWQLDQHCAQLCLQMQLWGQAERYLQKLSEEQELAWAYYAYGRLHEAQGKEAQAHFDKALELCARDWRSVSIDIDKPETDQAEALK